MDLWVAPLITGVFALFTHSQESWTSYHQRIVHRVGTPTIFGSFEYLTESDGPTFSVVKPMGETEARAVCALVLCALFSYRAIINFGIDWNHTSADLRTKRKRVIRSSECLLSWNWASLHTLYRT